MSKRTYYKSGQFSNEKEGQGYDKLIIELEKKIEERSSSPSSQYFKLTEKPKNSKFHYAEELKRQMDVKQMQKEIEKQERKKPGISEDYHGYPNLPQTPPNIRRQRELSQMKRVKEDLLSQLELKKKDNIAVRSLELELAKQSNFEDTQKYFEQKQQKFQKKEREKQLLLNA